MTLTLDLPPGVEETLAREAAQQGTTPERLALDGLRRLFPVAGDAPKTGADLLALWEQEGAFLAREDMPDSPELARQICEEAQHARDHLWERPRCLPPYPHRRRAPMGRVFLWRGHASRP